MLFLAAAFRSKWLCVGEGQVEHAPYEANAFISLEREVSNEFLRQMYTYAQTHTSARRYGCRYSADRFAVETVQREAPPRKSRKSFGSRHYWRQGRQAAFFHVHMRLLLLALQSPTISITMHYT